jgi:hypothetical protein
VKCKNEKTERFSSKPIKRSGQHQNHAVPDHRLHMVTVLVMPDAKYAPDRLPSWLPDGEPSASRLLHKSHTVCHSPLSSGGRTDKTVVAAFDVRMLFVAGNQQDSMHVAVRKCAEGDNPSTIINK